MLCDVCQKNEATIHIKEFQNGKIRTTHLCQECAAEREKQGELGAFGFNLAEMLFNIGQAVENSAANAPIVPEVKETVCPVCGWTSAKIKRSGGRLGCSECYRTFAPLIQEAIERAQAGTVHLGKRPASHSGKSHLSLKLEIEKYQKELQEHIKREEYEAAAVCRDKIQQLKAEVDAAEREVSNE